MILSPACSVERLYNQSHAQDPTGPLSTVANGTHGLCLLRSPLDRVSAAYHDNKVFGSAPDAAQSTNAQRPPLCSQTSSIVPLCDLAPTLTRQSGGMVQQHYSTNANALQSSSTKQDN